VIDRRYRALTEVSGLTDAELLVMALGGWHKLNAVLMCNPSIGELQRLLELELLHARRSKLIVRLRQAVGRELTAIATVAGERVIDCFEHGLELEAGDLVDLGLTRVAAERVVKADRKRRDESDQKTEQQTE
jgi:hypothetical protein